jgi:hypothetical protein
MKVGADRNQKLEHQRRSFLLRLKLGEESRYYWHVLGGALHLTIFKIGAFGIQILNYSFEIG